MAYRTSRSRRRTPTRSYRSARRTGGRRVTRRTRRSNSGSRAIRIVIETPQSSPVARPEGGVMTTMTTTRKARF